MTTAFAITTVAALALLLAGTPWLAVRHLRPNPSHQGKAGR